VAVFKLGAMELAHQAPKPTLRAAQPKGVAFQGTERRADAPKISAPAAKKPAAPKAAPPKLSARAPSLPQPAAPAPAKTAKAPVSAGRDDEWETF
jgi:methyl-accepting chemotaxis protein-1 (serine sensor receptor)